MQNTRRWPKGWLAVAMVLAACVTARAAETVVYADRANTVTFEAREVRFVRFVVHETASGTNACIDELEVYGPGSDANLALASAGAEASASSSLTGHAIHKAEHLNDGEYGNGRSWVAGGNGTEWAQIALASSRVIDRVVFSRDRGRQYDDRMPVRFEVRVSPDGEAWETVKKVEANAGRVRLAGRRGTGMVLPPAPPPPGHSTEAEQSAVAKATARAEEHGLPNLALLPEARAAASSCFAGNPKHQIAHLNDGMTGNEHSWVSAGDPSWAEIDLGGVYWVCRVAFASDATGEYGDRAATAFRILTAADYANASDAPAWRTVHETDGTKVGLRSAFTFEPVRARYIRVAVDRATSGQVRIDEIEVFGQDAAIPETVLAAMRESGEKDAPRASQKVALGEDELKAAFLGEEHAWLKVYGQADLSPRLVPYNGRVKEYPRRKGADRLPLPGLAAVPALDGSLEDPAWLSASRGEVRVAYPYDYAKGPLAEYALWAGRTETGLYLALHVTHLLSSHVAVVSLLDGNAAGVVAIENGDLVFNRYEESRGKVEKASSLVLEAASSGDMTRFEMRLPLELFPGWRDTGLRVGLGIGGRHTSREGRAIELLPARVGIAEAGPCIDGQFTVRFVVPDDGGAPVTFAGLEGAETDSVTVSPGTALRVALSPAADRIGPERDLEIRDSEGGTYALQMLRYDPMGRALRQMEDMVTRLTAAGRNVRQAREQFAALEERHADLMAAAPDPASERTGFYDARTAKRALFFSDPGVQRASDVLFVKRKPFQPSHNYSVILDAPFRPGGAVAVLHVPRAPGRLVPEKASVKHLFETDTGIPRTAATAYDLGTVYFALRPSEDGHFHIMAMNADGTGLRQVTDGPYHDYWPCPLPGGDLAVISTRCSARYLCWRPQVFVLFRMRPDGTGFWPLSYANLSEWAPSVMSDGRIIWTRSEYQDKGADFGHTLWAIRPDGTKPELVFGNGIIQPNGYANGREVPGTNEFACTLISHFGDLNGPIALVDVDKGRFNPDAITSLTPEVPWPGMWPMSECFRDPVPISRDHILCSHAPRGRFHLYIIDRHGNRELLYADPAISSMCPTVFRAQTPPPVLASAIDPDAETGEFFLQDVYKGIGHAVERGRVKYIRVVEEVRANLELLPSGVYRADHPDFLDWYATPIHVVNGPHGWPTYVAKAPHGLVPVNEDGSVRFSAPAGKTLYFQALDEDFNELQRMRSVVQLQPGEKRSCIGCHEHRQAAPPNGTRAIASMSMELRRPEAPSWAGKPFSFEDVVQPVLDEHCVSCHDGQHKAGLDLRGALDNEKVPASYRTLISKGLVHYCDMGWNSGGCEKVEPLSIGTVKSRLWHVLNKGHHEVELDRDEMRRLKTWIDLNCPLWPNYVNRQQRPGPESHVAKAR